MPYSLGQRVLYQSTTGSVRVMVIYAVRADDNVQVSPSVLAAKLVHEIALVMFHRIVFHHCDAVHGCRACPFAVLPVSPTLSQQSVLQRT